MLMCSLSLHFSFSPSPSLQSRFCTNLQLPSYVQKAASHIAEKAVQKDLAPG